MHKTGNGHFEKHFLQKNNCKKAAQVIAEQVLEFEEESPMHDWTSYNEFTEDLLWRCKSNPSDINKNP